jgi:predicted nuclease of predicted toxin-antitoxin system
MDYARENQLACVTLDHDFHLHLAQAAARGPSVVLLRVEGLTAPQQAELILWIWETCNAEIASGAAVSADRFTIRLRKLPLRIDPKPSG